MTKNNIVFFLVFLFSLGRLFAQDSTFVLSSSMFNESGSLLLPDLKEWQFNEGNDSTWANQMLHDESWQKLDSTKIANLKVDDNGLFEAWFKIKVKFDSSMLKIPIYLNQSNMAATEIYINGELAHAFGNASNDKNKFRSNNLRVNLPTNLSIPINEELLIAVHFVEIHGSFYKSEARNVVGEQSFLSFVDKEQFNEVSKRRVTSAAFFSTVISILGILVCLFWLLAFLNRSQGHLVYTAIMVTIILSIPGLNYIRLFLLESYNSNFTYIFEHSSFISMTGLVLFLPILIAKIFMNRIPRILKLYFLLGSIIMILSNLFRNVDYIQPFGLIIIILSIVIIIYIPISERKNLRGAKWIVVAGLIITVLIIVSGPLLDNLFGFNILTVHRTPWLISYFLTFPLSLLVYVAFWLKEMTTDLQQKADEIIKVTEDKKEILESQNRVLEGQVKARTLKLSQSIENLKSTQAQLIQSEKMASLGELTAGIAHEIQNPLNFVNNFSEVSEELIQEIKDERHKTRDERDEALEDEILSDIEQNLQKINHHGNRASGIVKGMLEHSRTSSGEKELTDINALADEYLRLSYHGLRAKDKSFNADFKTDFDKSLPKVEVVSQDIGRVLLNLINNAFQACAERSGGRSRRSAVHDQSKKGEEGYKPTVTVTTKLTANSQLLIAIKDNGSGIPDEIKDKIFQPFFTTKDTGKGTGLGLSLAYDIVKAHGGELKVKSTKEKGTDFSIILPIEEK